MRFFVRTLTENDAREIALWRYPAPYDVYTNDNLDPSADPCSALCDAQGVLLGFFAWAEMAQVSGATDLYLAMPALDFGMGLHPDLTGRGYGLMAATAALAWLRDQFAPKAFRLAVYAWNERARRVYTRLGFAALDRRGDFLIMTRDERPWRNATRALENGMRVYHADPGFERSLYYHKENCGWDMSVFSMSAHSGTHIDAPAHIGLPDGTETLPVSAMNGIAQCLDWGVSAPEAIRAQRVLLKTGGRGLSREEAQALLDAGVGLIGVDGLSVGEGDTEWAVHDMLLRAGVIILENAALEDFAPGWYEMCCLPLLMPGSDGAPVRLLLRAEGAL